MSTPDAIRRTVLVVDDDEAVRQVAAVILGELGFQVLEASNAEDALVILRAPNPVQLLLTDLAMPGVGGVELAHLARRLRPDLKVLYTSAYVRMSESSPALRYGPLIEKPWMLEQLKAVIEKLLQPDAEPT